MRMLQQHLYTRERRDRERESKKANKQIQCKNAIRGGEVRREEEKKEKATTKSRNEKEPCCC